MNHQITLEELGLIPKQEKKYVESKKSYAFPCGGCICNHCANSVECWDDCTGEMENPCFICDECIYYDGHGSSRKRTECENYKVTDKYAKNVRKKFLVRKMDKR